MVTKHTPGPDEDGSIADIFTDEIIAAWRVQSAAPDLLEALEKAREKIEIYRRHSGNYLGGMEASALLKMIEAAIAKARMP